MCTKNILCGGASVVTIALLSSGPVLAQEIAQATPPVATQRIASPPPTAEPSKQAAAAEAANGEGQEVAAVVVTGSRIQGTFTTPTPVTEVTARQLEATAVTTVAQGLQQLPAVTPGGGPTAGGGTGNGGQNFLALRGLGAARTLTLLDGRRFVPAGAAGTVDSNLIPSGLLQRVDVVTGGASAAYGSDAVAGVINFILNTKFEGTKVDVHYGTSEFGDNIDWKATLDYGRAFAGGKGHFVFSGEYYDNGGVLGDARAFRRKAANEVLDPANTSRFVRIDDLRTPYTLGGLMIIGAGGTATNNAVFEGIQFGPGGLPQPYSYGTFATDVGVNFGTQNGGDGFRVSTGQEIVRPLHRESLFAHSEFDFAPNLTGFAEYIYAFTDSDFASSPTTHTITIQRDNAYLARVAPGIVSQMTTLGVTRFTLNRLTLERGPTHTDNMNFTNRALFGLKGDVHNWNWDVAYQDGNNVNKAPVYNNLFTARMALAADAVVNPANGSIVCRSTLTAPTNGCVPFNPFGAGAPSAEALNYVMGTIATSTTDTRQRAADFNASGKLFKLPAGDVSLAFGGEWRALQAKTIADANSNAGAFRLVNQQDFFGKYNVKEYYVESQAPILVDKPFAKELSINVAGRHTIYSTSGGVDTWKAGVNWQINDQIRFRYTRSRDIRAPNLSELFATGRQNNIVVVDTLTNRTYNAVPNRTFGNIDLLPEIADTDVLGVVYQPHWLEGASFALDRWKITINGAIGNIGGNNAVNQCNLSNQTSPICAFVTRDPTTQAVIATLTAPANLTVNNANGYDFEASYRVPLKNWIGGDPGNLTVRGLVGFRGENKTISPLVFPAINTAGQQGNPKWRATLNTSYSKGPFRTTLVARYIGEQIWDKTRTLGVDTDFQHIPSAVYLDGAFTYEFKPSQEIYLNVQNILDKKPVYSPGTGGATPLPTDTGLYDQVGRMWTVGVRLRL